MSEPRASQTRGFLFADLRDYTRFVETHGDQAAADLLARYRALVRDVVARFDGAEIRTEGDSFYVVFSSASAAVNGGLAILEAAARASDPAAGAIRVGVGVHAGETAETPEGFVGSAVNVAARICALAGPGELLVSETVHGLTRTFLPVRFVPAGRRRLKGIAEQVAVYRVLPTAPNAVAGVPRAAIGERRRPSRRVAVSAIALPLGLLAVAAFLFIAAGLRTATSPTATALVTGGAEASADPSSMLTAAQARLQDKLPAAFGRDCLPSSAAEGSAGGAVSLVCQLPLSAPAEKVWIDEFTTSEALDGAFADAAARTRAPDGDCATMPLAKGAWQALSVHSGRVLCYPADDGVELVWTYADDRILMRARRGDGDWQGLWAWWNEARLFLR